MIKISISNILIISIITLYSCSTQTTGEKLMNAKRPILGVDGMVVQLKDIDHSFVVTGNVLANEEIELRPESSGRIVKILFQEGTKVEKGQLLIKINDNDLQAQLKKNDAQLELALVEVNRKSELLKINGISKEEFDVSNNKLRTLQAEKELVLAQIDKTEIHAPFSGIIGLRMVSEGAFASPASTISTLQQIDPVKIDFSVPEKLKQFIARSNEIKFTVEGSEKVFKAKIYALESKIDIATRSIKVRALVPNPNNLLFPGAFAKISLNFFEGRKSIVIPTRALVPVVDGEIVYLIQKGIANPVKVKSGLRSSTDVEIVEGLAVNDTLITSGLMQVKKGMNVSCKL